MFNNFRSIAIAFNYVSLSQLFQVSYVHTYVCTVCTLRTVVLLKNKPIVPITMKVKVLKWACYTLLT